MIVAARKRARHFAAEERGAAMVEFAIVAALLFVLVFGIVDFGRAYLLISNLTNAVREGARYAAVIQDPVTNCASVRTVVRAKITVGPSGSGTITCSLQGAAPSQTVRVALTGYPFNPVSFLALKANKTLADSAEFRYEFQ